MAFAYITLIFQVYSPLPLLPSIRADTRRRCHYYAIMLRLMLPLSPSTTDTLTRRAILLRYAALLRAARLMLRATC